MIEYQIQRRRLGCKPNVSDGLWACWVFNPTYPLCHFFLHSTIKQNRPSESFQTACLMMAKQYQEGRCNIHDSILRASFTRLSEEGELSNTMVTGWFCTLAFTTIERPASRM